MSLPSVSANILVRNERRHIVPLIQNLIDSGVDEIVFLDGGSTDGTWAELQRAELQYSNVLNLRWPQRAGTEYRREFNEVARRNLMIEASSSEFILYIDADERIALDFKRKISTATDCTAVSFTSFWAGNIRVNGPGDRVWFPDMKFRIFRRSPSLRFRSADANGLHNYLARDGVRIPLGVTRGTYHASAAKLVRFLLGMRCEIGVDPPRIFHYHYFDLARKKVNDLRAAEFDWPIMVNVPAEQRTRAKTVYVIRPERDEDAGRITERYWNDSE